MIVAEIAFLRRCRIEPEHHKHNTRSYDETHGGAPPTTPLPKTRDRRIGFPPPQSLEPALSPRPSLGSMAAGGPRAISGRECRLQSRLTRLFAIVRRLAPKTASG